MYKYKSKLIIYDDNGNAIKEIKGYSDIPSLNKSICDSRDCLMNNELRDSFYYLKEYIYYLDYNFHIAQPKDIILNDYAKLAIKEIIRFINQVETLTNTIIIMYNAEE